MSAWMWRPDNPKIIVATGNWATVSRTGKRSFRLNRSETPWFAMQAKTGEQVGPEFHTHAEAIAYAQEHAKTQALKEPS